MRAAARLTAILVALILLGAACDPSDDPGPRPRSPSPELPASPRAHLGIEVPPKPSREETSTRAMRRLCEVAEPGSPPTRGEGSPDPEPVPEGVREIMRAVESIRGLPFLEEIRAEPLNRRELRATLEAVSEGTYPEAQLARRSAAWWTIGAIPEGVSLVEELTRATDQQVVGFYVPSTKELYYLGGGGFQVLSRLALVHELTHALDDQHFDLGELDRLRARCLEEEAAAALGAIEGSAQLATAAFALTSLSPGDRIRALTELPTALVGTPDLTPFLTDLLIWPYVRGQTFMATLEARGGMRSADGALWRLPVSTEQVLHPEKYPHEAPREIDVPDLSSALGSGWGDIDVMDVGEAWLDALLRTRLDAGGIRGATEGWDGGRYRAWSDGVDVAVLMVTAWDTVRDARDFETAMGRFVRAVGTPGDVRRDGDVVTVSVATDPAVLDRLLDAAAAEVPPAA